MEGGSVLASIGKNGWACQDLEFLISVYAVWSPPTSRAYLKSSHIEIETFMGKTFSHEGIFVFLVKSLSQ